MFKGNNNLKENTITYLMHLARPIKSLPSIMLDTPKVNSALTGDTEYKIATSIGKEGLVNRTLRIMSYLFTLSQI